MFKKFHKLLLLLILFTFVNGSEVNLNKLIEQAKSQNKFILFFHHIPGCPYCSTMLDENFKDPKILEIINKDFIYVDIYTGNTNTIIFKDFKGTPSEFSKYIGAFAYPATLFMDAEGKVIHKAIGYRNIDEYIADITYISTLSYNEMKFEAYKWKLDFEKD
ncbi:MAG: thioredoxin fold domain-containing protein [Campylobacterota bacterium]|nr:thioredoxin fold domain-containing protein [Campylobacterota bacterium]